MRGGCGAWSDAMARVRGCCAARVGVDLRCVCCCVCSMAWLWLGGYSVHAHVLHCIVRFKTICIAGEMDHEGQSSCKEPPTS